MRSARCIAIQIVDREVETAAQQARRQVLAEITETDKAVAHETSPGKCRGMIPKPPCSRDQATALSAKRNVAAQKSARRKAIESYGNSGKDVSL